MTKPVRSLAAALTLLMTFLAASQAQEIDFTKRQVTDPLLKISTSTQLLPASDDKGLDAKRDEDHVPPVYKYLWNRQDVIMLEPLSKTKPAEIDFSAITATNKGVLRITARNHPAGDFVLEIYKGGQLFKKETIGGDKWERFQIPFDKENVVVKCAANGWNFEFAFIDYAFGRNL